MKTNRPSGHWQSDKETEKEERGEERERQRGACKETNEVMQKKKKKIKAGSKE